MSINKNFVVKNGLQVSDSLVFADAAEGRVGIGTTIPTDHLLHVFGGIGVTDAYVTGISTFGNSISVGPSGSLLSVVVPDNFVGVGTAVPEYLLDIRSNISTGQTSLYVDGSSRITGNLSVESDAIFDDVNIRNIDVSGISSFIGIGYFDDDLTVGGNLDVVGNGTVDGLFTPARLVVSETSSFVGNGSFGSDLSVGGNLNVGGNGVVNNLLLSGGLNVSGVSTLTNKLEIRSTDSEPGRIDFYCEVNNLHRVRLKAPLHSEFTGNPDVILPNVSGDLLVGDTASPITQDLNTTGNITANYFYGDGTHLDNVIRGIGIQTGGGPVSYGATIIDFAGPGVSTAYYDSNVGVGTIFFQGGGGAKVAVSDNAPSNANLGDLWFHSELGRTFIYYDETELGTGSDSFWVDAAPTDPTKFPSTVKVGTGITFYGNSGDSWFGGTITTQDLNILSDINFKENILTVDNALDKVMNLRGVSFDWKKSKEPSFGVIAQELEQVFPELVRGESPKTVNYIGLVGILIESIKDMKHEIVSLNDEIQYLKRSINN